jgi:hypothetical protein
VAGVLALIVDLTQKLRERPTPKFSEAVASCDRASHTILIATTKPGLIQMGRSFRIGFSIPKKKWPLFGRATSIYKNLISVYQRACCSANLFDNPPKKSGHTS